MGFFSELKSDLSQAAKTIMPEESEEAQSLNKTAEKVAAAEEDTAKEPYRLICIQEWG